MQSFIVVPFLVSDLAEGDQNDVTENTSVL